MKNELSIEDKKKLFIYLGDIAIDKVEKYIKIVSRENNERSLLLHLERGLHVLKAGKANFEKMSIEEFEEDLEDRIGGQRAGLGLSRGFGEYLRHGNEWEKEIMEAIFKLEDYYASM